MFYCSVCPDPDEVNLATKNPDQTTYFANETFSYVCRGTLVLAPNTPNTCSTSNNARVWDLSKAAGNLPKCGKPFLGMP